MIELVPLLFLVIKMFSCMSDFAPLFKVPPGYHHPLRPTLATPLRERQHEASPKELEFLITKNHIYFPQGWFGSLYVNQPSKASSNSLLKTAGNFTAENLFQCEERVS
ncbi:hypothetical protein AVEN_108420-1 [Araneus ventricosus]|uniref:Uncharacterized protein n=1 Tax=Araneus ventricosus TaxID=182803 RepID=A0A4Y2NUT4_ARAVE|nr:hypothetical protein AVEN_108420-1 [Araneus ventricosus]